MRCTLIAFITLSCISLSFAQKFGHLNSMDLLRQIPGIVQADSVLVIYQQDIQKQGDSMVAAFRANYEAYVKDAQSGTLSKLQAQTREMELQKEQESIQKFERESQNKVVQRRQELYEPILNEVDEAIRTLGVTGGYTMIFDSSQQSMVFLTPSMDVSTQVLALIKK
jgi:outer membrane protein